MKTQNQKFIHVRLDDRGLWTADLRNDQEIIKNLGGSYPKSQSATYDAKLSWGKELPIRIGELASTLMLSEAKTVKKP